MSVRFGSEEYKYGLPMAADLVQMEPFFWPGTSIVTDGRGANAFFLRSNFKRSWTYRYDEECDQHLFKLKDEHFGKISKALLELKNISLDKEWGVYLPQFWRAMETLGMGKMGFEGVIT